MSQIVEFVLLASFPLKAVAHYWYTKAIGAKQADSVTDYLYALPIISGPANSYKVIVNSIVILQYSIVIALLLVNQKQLLDILENWKNIP